MAEPVAKVLPQRGTTLKLTDGKTVKPVFSLYVLARVEEEFGNLDALISELNQGVKSKIISLSAKLISFALEDEDGNPTHSPAQLLRKLEMAQLGEVVTLVQEGLAKGFQALQGPKKASRSKTPATVASPGAESSTSDASSSDSVNVISGA